MLSQISADVESILSETQAAEDSVSNDIDQLLRSFLLEPVTPQAAMEFESVLQERLRELGRKIVQVAYNRLEAEQAKQMPKQMEYEGYTYSRKNDKTKNRGGVGTLFGTIELRRFSYEPLCEARHEQLPSLSPLERCLGIVAGKATPALAERVGRLAADQTQGELLQTLDRDHQVQWSVQSLREVTAVVSEGIAEHLHATQKVQVLAWLKEADESKGRYKPTLSVGRDGIMLPMRDEKTYKEGAVATVSVYDRRGRRLGTLYLGQMPEAYQTTLSEQLTHLLNEVLKEWDGSWPRLSYVTDAGYHPTQYFKEVLQKLDHPRHAGRKMEWSWTVDFYHACEYLATLAEVLFLDPQEAHAWQRRMRHRLKHEPNAVFRILHSAARYHSNKFFTQKDEKAYRQAYQYLNKHKNHMNYPDKRRLRLPIGSGVTEAGCKTIFTQRFKESGMSWGKEGGQVILQIRLATRSRIWESVYQKFLNNLPLPKATTKPQNEPDTDAKAA